MKYISQVNAHAFASVATSVDDDDGLLVAVMGARGSGKSTFINLVSGSTLCVASGLGPCTSQAETSEVFTLEGRPVTLIDTPGFDDTNLSDTDIMKIIAAFLDSAFKAGRKLSGVIYMHRISDSHVGGIARRNFSMFRKLCGDDTLGNVVIVTNAWGEVLEQDGAAREEELRTDPNLFKPAIEKGAIMMRHYDNLQSAQEILRCLIKKHPIPLCIQEELVLENENIMDNIKKIDDTARDRSRHEYASTATSVYDDDDDDDDGLLVAVMGARGSGKSTFINLVSDSTLPVGSGLGPCTSQAETSNVFILDNRPITVIDTPGFDDSNISDTDVLKIIAAFLESVFKSGQKLSGVIYMHRISDVRVGGIAKRNFSMFRKLCGDDTLGNVVIVMNMWGEVLEQDGAAREHELRTDSDLFQPVIEKGAVMMRHHNTVKSAQEILRYLIKKRPVTLRIQRELVLENKNITDTAAGEELNRGIQSLIKRHEAEMEKLVKELRQALAEKDLGTKMELEEAYSVFMDKIRKIGRTGHDRLKQEYEEERRHADEHLREVEIALAEERQAREKRQADINHLKPLLQENDQASWAERLQWADRLRELEAKQKKKGVMMTIRNRLFGSGRRTLTQARRSTNDSERPAIMPEPEAREESGDQDNTATDDQHILMVLQSLQTADSKLPETIATQLTEVSSQTQSSASPFETCVRATVRSRGRDTVSDLVLCTLLKFRDDPSRGGIKIRRTLMKYANEVHAVPSTLFVHDVVCTEGEKVTPCGYGGFADVFSGQRLAGPSGRQTVALKRLRRNLQSGAHEDSWQLPFFREALLWRQLRHPHILEFLGLDDLTFRGSICMISPWMANGDLASYIKNHRYIDQRRRYGWIGHVMEGLQYLHGELVVHGDLRGANVLLDEQLRACISDFGLSMLMDAGLSTVGFTTRKEGAMRWMAPEVIRTGVCDTKGDVYSFGCVCLEIVSGQIPLPNLRSDHQVYAEVVSQRIQPTWPSISIEDQVESKLGQLVRQCWHINSAERPSVQEVVTQLRLLL